MTLRAKVARAMGLVQGMLAGSALLVGGASAYMVYDFQKNRFSETEDVKEAFRHYVAVRGLSIVGTFRRKRLEKLSKEIAETQETFLLQQLKINADTKYGRQHNFSSIKSVEDFRANHPLTRYSHYEEYVRRMMDGEEKILTAQKPGIFAVTSGTSGNSNVIPMVRRQVTKFLLDGISVVYSAMERAIPETRFLQKDMKLFYTPNWRTSKAGIPVGPNSSSPTRSKSTLYMYSTPEVAYEITKEPEALYIYLLFGLKDRTLGLIEANFASLIFNAFIALEFHWDQLVCDIEQGSLNPNLKIPEDVRNKLNALLTPDPKRAAELRAAYQDGRVGLAKRVWPHLRVMVGADTGSFDLYGKRLRETYGAGVPLYSPIYGATEGLLGINIWPLNLPSRYMLIPTAQFFEFIPIDKVDEENPKTLLMHEVKVGGEYEMVITNPSCMYRYRFGDVVRVDSLHNQCPVIEFLYRQGQFLNLRGEKTSEALFYKALGEAVSGWTEVKLMDYCCVESVLVDGGNFQGQPCYHVFIELEGDKKRLKGITNAEKKMIDAKLQEKSFVFDSFRKKGSIGPTVVHIVQPGSFQKLREFIIETSAASSNQYKVPRVLRKKEFSDFISSLKL